MPRMESVASTEWQRSNETDVASTPGRQIMNEIGWRYYERYNEIYTEGERRQTQARVGSAACRLRRYGPREADGGRRGASGGAQPAAKNTDREYNGYVQQQTAIIR